MYVCMYVKLKRDRFQHASITLLSIRVHHGNCLYLSIFFSIDWMGNFLINEICRSFNLNNWSQAIEWCSRSSAGTSERVSEWYWCKIKERYSVCAYIQLSKKLELINALLMTNTTTIVNPIELLAMPVYVNFGTFIISVKQEEDWSEY